MYERISQPEEHPSTPPSADLAELVGQNRRIARALRTLSAGNRTLLHASDEQVLLTDMCRVAVEHGGYLLAMVNYAIQNESKSVRTKAHFGKNDGFIEALNLTWADTERGQGTVGIAIRSGQHCIFHSTSTEPRFRPWREEAIKHGFLSLISLLARIVTQQYRDSASQLGTKPVSPLRRSPGSPRTSRVRTLKSP